jgi:hypothetical protein
MLRDDAIDEIRESLGFRGPTFLPATIVNALKEAQRKLELRPLLPWFLRTEISSVLTTAGEERLGLPADFIREDEETALWYFDAAAVNDEDKWTELIKDDSSVLRKRYPTPGIPKAYSIHGDYFRLFPTPDAAYTLKLSYYQKAEVLDTNIENVWLANSSDLLIGEAGKRVAAKLRDADAIAIFKDMIAEGQAQLLIDTEARRHENTRYIIGELD